MAVLQRWKFAASSEQLQGEQRTLFDETLDADLEALGLELEALRSKTEKAPPKAPPSARRYPRTCPAARSATCAASGRARGAKP